MAGDWSGGPGGDAPAKGARVHLLSSRAASRARPGSGRPALLERAEPASEPAQEEAEAARRAGKRSKARLDLAVYSEATRQAIYDFVLGETFTRKTVRGVESDPLYDPAESELQVLFLFGRWLVTYRTMGAQARLPERARRALLLVEQDERGRLALREI